MKANEVKGAISVTVECTIEGKVVFETTCRDYEHYMRLPAVVSYKNVHCRLTGWNSDRHVACYQQSTYIAQGLPHGAGCECFDCDRAKGLW